MANEDIRKAAANAGVFLWEIAEGFGISDTNFSKRLRRELPDKDKAKIYEIIKRIKATR